MGTVIDSDRRTSALVRAANRMRALLENGSRTLPAGQSALFAGLVYGDDSRQSTDTIEDFRDSGLAHLTAVSGQNVVFVLALAAPLLVRLRRPARVFVTLVVLAWFAVMTRLEPSVLRAVIMAGTTSIMVGVGRPISSFVSLCVTVGAATLVDPFLVWSVGWWLSVSGCAGLVLLSEPLARAFGKGPAWLGSWIAPTLAAQVGVLGVLVAVFGWPSAVSVPCNLLAAPVAGLVMLVGLPAALVAGLLPTAMSTFVMWPIGWGVAWVEGVAKLGAHLETPMFIDRAVSVATIVAIVRFLWISRRAVRGQMPSEPLRL